MYSFGRTNSSLSVQNSPCTSMSAHLPGQADVVDLWLCPVFALQDGDALGHDGLGHRIVGGFEVRDLPCSEWAVLHAGRGQPLRDAVIAEGAFLCCTVDGMEEPGAVWASHDAVAAPDAPSPIDENDAVGSIIGGPDRTDLHTGGIGALVA